MLDRVANAKVPGWNPDFYSAFTLSLTHPILWYAEQPPSASEAMESLHKEGMHKMLYTAPFFGRMNDVPRNSREYGGVRHKLRSHDYTHLPIFDPTRTGTFTEEHTISNQNWWIFASEPPTRSEASQWAALDGAELDSGRQVKAQQLSQVCFVPYTH